VITDDRGRLTLLTEVRDTEKIRMRIIESDFDKFRFVEAHYGDSQADFFCTVSKEAA
jgi:hypothetical protein